MITLTRNNAKERCRTCLRKLIKNELEFTAVDENSGGDKNNFICINANREIRDLLEKYVGIEGSSEANQDADYPLNVCIECVKQLQTFEAFRQKALDSAEKLYRVFCGTANVHKIELDDDGMESKEVVREQLSTENDNNVFNLLVSRVLTLFEGSVFC